MIAKREVLAEYAHSAWVGGMKYLFEISDHNSDGTTTIPRWAVERWERQTITEYAALPEDEKECGREGADRILAILKPARQAASCSGCAAKPGDPDTLVDLAEVEVAGRRSTLCQSCALRIVETLLDRFYGIWGDGPLHDERKKRAW